MEFVLNEYHRNVPEEELLADLVSVAAKLQKTTITVKEYSGLGKYSGSTFQHRFGTWANALTKAGLKTFSEYKNMCTSINDFIEDVKNVAIQLKKDSITSTEYRNFGKYPYYYSNYNLGWNDVLKMAGLNATQYRIGKDKKISDAELFEDIERVWIKLGRQPTVTDLKNGHFKFGQNTFVRRFGGWRGALNAFVDYINTEDTNDVNEEKDSREEKERKQASDQEQTLIHHKTKREPNLRLRFQVMHRDNFKCCQCGRSPALDSSVVLHVDHIFPWAKGGETTLDNLRTLCQECNLGKSDLICEDLL